MCVVQSCTNVCAVLAAACRSSGCWTLTQPHLVRCRCPTWVRPSSQPSTTSTAAGHTSTTALHEDYESRVKHVQRVIHVSNQSGPCGSPARQGGAVSCVLCDWCVCVNFEGVSGMVGWCKCMTTSSTHVATWELAWVGALCTLGLPLQALGPACRSSLLLGVCQAPLMGA